MASSGTVDADTDISWKREANDLKAEIASLTSMMFSMHQLMLSSQSPMTPVEVPDSSVISEGRPPISMETRVQFSQLTPITLKQALVWLQ